MASTARAMASEPEGLAVPAGEIAIEDLFEELTDPPDAYLCCELGACLSAMCLFWLQALF